MHARRWLARFAALLIGQLVWGLPAQAQLAQAASHADAAGGEDHPLMQRFEGSWLIAWRKAGHAETQPLAMVSDAVAQQKGLNHRLSVEGLSTELYYVSPAGRGSQEVQRAYEDVLKKAGATLVYSCTDDGWGCYTRGGPAVRLLADGSVPREQQVPVRWGTSLAFGPMSRNLRLAVYRLTRPVGDTWVTVYTVDTPSDVREFANRAASYVQLIEPKPAEAEKAAGVLDASQLARGIVGDGRVILPALSFTSGRRPQLKREATPQLAEIAKLMIAKPDLRLFVVAHSDNLADKGALTHARLCAEAVAAMLTKRYGIERTRITPRSADALAPLARNNTEAGRARNRRIELVER
jgi:OOP family OmpA-OmpF porin